MDEDFPGICNAELSSWNGAVIETDKLLQEWEKRNSVDCSMFICNIAADFWGL
jgi:hypothetical protein